MTTHKSKDYKITALNKLIILSFILFNILTTSMNIFEYHRQYNL